MENKKIQKIVQTFQKNWLLSFPLGIFLGAAGMWASGFPGEPGRHTAEEMSKTKLPQSLSAADYFQQIRELEGQFLKLKEYKESLIGLTVEWDGVIMGLIEDKLFFPFDLFIKPNYSLKLHIPNNQWNWFWVDYSSEWRLKLYSLNEGDLVKVYGKVKRVNTYITIDGDGIRRVSLPVNELDTSRKN